MEHPKIGFIVNLNKLYTGTTPTHDNIDEYYKKLQNMLPDAKELSNYTILIIGTGPAWLTVKIVGFLSPWVAQIYLDGRDGPEEVYTSANSGLSIKRRPRNMQ